MTAWHGLEALPTFLQLIVLGVGGVAALDDQQTDEHDTADRNTEENRP